MKSPQTSVWCALRVEHEYFAKPHFAKLLRLAPTAETERYGIAIRPVDDHALIYGPPNTARPPSLGFAISFHDPDFPSYTDFGDRTPVTGKTIYLNPQTNNVIEAAAAPQLDVRPRRFSQPLTDKVKAVELGPIGGTLRNLPIGPGDRLRQSLNINLEGDPAGGYLLKTIEKSKTSEDRFYLTDEFTPPVAAFEWRPDEKKTPTDQSPTFTLKFSARETYWRYYLIGLPEDLWSVTSIAPAGVNGNGNGKPNVSFTAAKEPFTLPDGRKALVYRSAQPIPRRQQQRLKVKLKSSSVFDGHQLPHAGNRLAFAKNAKDEVIVCSEIFVQL